MPRLKLWRMKRRGLTKPSALIFMKILASGEWKLEDLIAYYERETGCRNGLTLFQHLRNLKYVHRVRRGWYRLNRRGRRYLKKLLDAYREVVEVEYKNPYR